MTDPTTQTDAEDRATEYKIVVDGTDGPVFVTGHSTEVVEVGPSGSSPGERMFRVVEERSDGETVKKFEAPVHRLLYCMVVEG